MSLGVAQKVVTVALAVGVGGAGVAMVRSKLGCAPQTCSAPAMPDLGASLPPVYPTGSMPDFGDFGSTPPITPPSSSESADARVFGLPGTVNQQAAASDSPVNDPHWEPGEYGSADEPSDPQSTNAPTASAPNPGSMDWNRYALPGGYDTANVAQPGAPAPDDLVEGENPTAAGDSQVGDGDAIAEVDTSEGDTHGLSGIGEGGGGTGEGIGLGNIDIFSQKSGGGGPGYGAGAATAQSQSAPRAAEPEAATIDEELTEVDRKLAKLPLGNIAFNTPETIPLGESASIELLLSVREAKEQLQQAVRAAGPVETSRVKITDQMEARLTGLGFRVEAATPERQAVSRTERTAWKWQIEPTKPAKLELNLTLSALIEVDGVPTPRAIQTFARTIYVDVPMGQRVTNLLSNNFELITSVLLVPAAGGIYHTYRKRKRRQASPDDSTPTRKAA